MSKVATDWGRTQPRFLRKICTFTSLSPATLSQKKSALLHLSLSLSLSDCKLKSYVSQALGTGGGSIGRSGPVCKGGICSGSKIMDTHTQILENIDSPRSPTDQNCSGNDSIIVNASTLGSVCENTAVTNNKQDELESFFPDIRAGEWSDIGGRQHMEDTHICIADLAKKFGQHFLDKDAISFFGVFDGHGGKDAANFVRDNLPRVIVEDAEFPLKLEKVVARSFMQTDAAFAEKCTVQSTLSSGTTALTAMIFGRSLLVANAGDCRAVLSRRGAAVEMSKDHRPCCKKEKRRIESLGGFIDDGYLNGELGVTRALGDWHIKGMKKDSEQGGPLSAEPELKLITLTKEDEFLIIGSDGIWDVFTSENAVDFARRRLRRHNNVKLCCKEVVEEAIKRGAIDNLTVVIVLFHSELPPNAVVHRPRVRSLSAEGLHIVNCLLEA